MEKPQGEQQRRDPSPRTDRRAMDVVTDKTVYSLQFMTECANVHRVNELMRAASGDGEDRVVGRGVCRWRLVQRDGAPVDLWKHRERRARHQGQTTKCNKK